MKKIYIFSTLIGLLEIHNYPSRMNWIHITLWSSPTTIVQHKLSIPWTTSHHPLLKEFEAVLNSKGSDSCSTPSQAKPGASYRDRVARYSKNICVYIPTYNEKKINDYYWIFLKYSKLIYKSCKSSINFLIVIYYFRCHIFIKEKLFYTRYLFFV